LFSPLCIRVLTLLKNDFRLVSALDSELEW
jgi:hypothetical protein